MRADSKTNFLSIPEVSTLALPCHRLHHLTLETMQALQTGLQAIHDQPMGWNQRLPASFRKRIGRQCISLELKSTIFNLDELNKYVTVKSSAYKNQKGNNIIIHVCAANVSGAALKAVTSLLAVKNCPNTLGRPLHYVPLAELEDFSVDSFFGSSYAHFAVQDGESPPIQLKPSQLLRPRSLDAHRYTKPYIFFDKCKTTSFPHKCSNGIGRSFDPH